MNTTKNQKAYKGLPMEGPVASWYAKITFKDVYRHQLMARELAPKIKPGGQVLEIAPGPGYFVIELAKLGSYQITGLDISKSFVEIARQKAVQAGIKAEFRQGDAANMPFQDGTFDFMFCQAAFKNFAQPVKAIAEMYRCLRPGGRAVIADMRSDASRADMDAEVSRMGLNSVDELFTRWTYHNMLIKSAYSVAEMQSFIAQTPFKKSKIDLSGIGFMLWLEK